MRRLEPQRVFRTTLPPKQILIQEHPAVVSKTKKNKKKTAWGGGMQMSSETNRNLDQDKSKLCTCSHRVCIQQEQEETSNYNGAAVLRHQKQNKDKNPQFIPFSIKGPHHHSFITQYTHAQQQEYTDYPFISTKSMEFVNLYFGLP